MSLLCDQWHVLADAIARHTGRDRFELPTDLHGCCGLHVEGVVMRRAALLKQDDTCSGSSWESRNRITRLLRRARARLTKRGQRPTTGAQRPQLKHIAAAEQVHEDLSPEETALASTPERGHLASPGGVRPFPLADLSQMGSFQGHGS